MHIDDQENIFDNEVLLGKIQGFKFISSDDFQESDVLNNLVIEHLTKKIDKLINDGDNVLTLDIDFNVIHEKNSIAQIRPTDDILRPDFESFIDQRIQAIPLARFVLHLESWLKRQTNVLIDAFDAVKNVENLEADVSDFLKQLIQNLGYVARKDIDQFVKKISPNDRAKLRKVGVRFAQYSVFIRDALKPAAQKIKLILWALFNKLSLPELPPSGVVTIPVNKDFPDRYYDIAGYRVCGDFAVRIDMIEKLADSVRGLTLKSDDNPSGEFEITSQHMSFVGKSGDAFNVILKTLGYDYRTETVKVISVEKIKSPESETSQTSEIKVTADTQNITDEIKDIESEINLENKAETLNLAEAEVEVKADADESSDIEANVKVIEKEVEKNIWFWAPPAKLKNAKAVDAKNISKTNFNHKKSSKPKNSFDKKHNKKKNKPQENTHNSYGNLPKKHKISAENNPFAALQQLKGKN